MTSSSWDALVAKWGINYPPSIEATEEDVKASYPCVMTGALATVISDVDAHEQGLYPENFEDYYEKHRDKKDCSCSCTCDSWGLSQ
jgi:hypothetical protein